jgi:hypothetical protein
MRKLISAAMLAGAIVCAASAGRAQTDISDQPQPSKPSCFDSVWDFLKSSVRDCPLTVGPFTLYGFNAQRK